MADASLRLVQQRIFDLMMAAEGGNLKEFAATARALADTARASLTVRQERRKVLHARPPRRGCPPTRKPPSDPPSRTSHKALGALTAASSGIGSCCRAPEETARRPRPFCGSEAGTIRR